MSVGGDTGVAGSDRAAQTKAGFYGYGEAAASGERDLVAKQKAADDEAARKAALPPNSAGATGYADVGAEAQTGDILRRRDEFALKYQDYQNRTAPQMAAANLAAPVLAAPPQPFTTHQAAGPDGIVARQAAATMTAPTTVGHTAVGPASTYNAADIASGGTVDVQGGFRGAQASSIDALQAAANGGGPSAAQETLKMAQARGIAAQMAMRGAARGSGVARAQRAAADGSAQVNADTAAQASVMAAQEQATARGQLSTALVGARGQDITGESTNAQLGTQSAIEQARLRQAAVADAAGAKNVLTGQQANISAGEVGQQGTITAAEAAQRAALGTNVSITNTAQENDVNKFLTDEKVRNQQFNAGQLNDVDKQTQALGSDVGKFNAGQANIVSGHQGDLTQQQNLANLTTSTQWAQMDDAQKNALLTFLSQSQDQGLQGAGIHANYYAQAQKNKMDFVKGLVGTGVGVATGIATGGASTAAQGLNDPNFEGE
jgi:hypothetical protein